MANLFPRSQRTASIALSVVGCIDYLAYGAIVHCKGSKKMSFLIPAKKAQDVRREEVNWIKQNIKSSGNKLKCEKCVIYQQAIYFYT